MAGADGCAVWVVPPAQKVFKEDAPGAKARAEVRMAAARNETEAAQIVFRPDREMEVRSIEVSPLKGAKGAVFPAENIHLHRVAYIHLPVHKKDFPDPLPPLTLPLALKAGESQPVWVRVEAPEEIKPGSYKGQIQVVFSDGSRRALPFDLTVWNFSVPVKPSMRTAFGISDGFIARQHGAEAGSLKHRKLVEKYYEFLVSHRISPYSIPSDIRSPGATRYLDDPRVTAFVIPYSDDEAELKQTVDFLREKGWLGKGYFYVVDEPIKQEQYERLKAVCEKIHRIDPALKIVAPCYRDPDFGSGLSAYDVMAGYVNLWCPETIFYKADKVKPRQKLGEEVWWYVCCGPGKPYANFFVDMDGMAHRLLFWQQKQCDVEGLLYWSTTYWNPSSTEDPWTDIATVKDINPAVYGDGSLIYPGAKVGVDGPVSSIRLELARDGMEDYEYLTLYEKAFGRDRTDALIGQLVKSLTEFSTDPLKLEKTRLEMGRAIEKRRL